MSQKFNVLVVEDEADIRDLMVMHLKREGANAVGIDNGEEALKLFHQQKFELAVLDWMLPGLSGLELCKKMSGALPILMVTARADTADIVLGLEMGADDYITKPFEIPVFLARVRALLRRSQQPTPTGTEQVQIGNLKIDFEAHEIFCGEEKIHLTASEFKLLGALIKNQGRVLSRNRLIELVQGQGIAVIDRAIDTHIFGLRKKLGDCSDVIETIRGVGYRVKPS